MLLTLVSYAWYLVASLSNLFSFSQGIYQSESLNLYICLFEHSYIHAVAEIIIGMPPHYLELLPGNSNV